MKTLTLTIGLFFTALFLNAQQIVTVKISNVLNDNGTIIAALHTADTFMKGPGVQNVEVKAEKGEVTLTFKDVEPGTYAVMAMHDENDNKQMDYQPNGMPKEYYGVSNNPMNTMGPPQFESAKFDITTEDKELVLRF